MVFKCDLQIIKMRLNNKLLLIIQFSLLFSNGLFCQETFSKFYNIAVGEPYGNEFARSVIILQDGYCISVAGVCTTPEINGCGNIFFTDKKGNIKWEKNLNWFRNGERESLIEYNDTIYLSGTKDQLHYNEGDAYILKLNIDGDSLDLMHQHFHNSYNKWGVPVSMVYLDKHLYTINHHQAFDSQKFPELMKWDLSGNLIFDKLYYEEIGKVAYSYGLITTKDKNLILVYNYIESKGFTAEILKVDQNGDKIWKKSYKSENIRTSPRVVQLNNGTLVMSYTYSIQDYDSLLVQRYFPHSIRLVNLSEDGTEQLWQHQFDRQPYYRSSGLQYMTSARNGDIIGAGGQSSIYLKDSTDYGVGWIFRMSPEGKLLWEHFYQDEGYPGDYGIRSVKEDNDGNIVAVGEVIIADSTNIQDNQFTWMLKVDSMGCLTPGCTSEDTIQYITTNIINVPYSKVAVKIYPNPVKEVLSIETSSDYIIKEWQIIDVLGRRIKTGLIGNLRQIDVKSLKTGIYFLHLVDNSGLKYVSKFIKQ